MPFHPSLTRAPASDKLPSIVTLLKSCKNSAHIHQLHAQIIVMGLEQDQFVASHFVCLSYSLSSLAYCSRFFGGILDPSPVLWNSLVKGYCERASWVETLSVFGRMRRAGAVPDKFTYPSVLKSCAGGSRVREGRAVHGGVVKSGLDGDVFVGTSLVDLYGKCGEIVCARKVFDAMPQRSVVSWTAMVVGYIGAGDLVEARRLFREMPLRNVKSWNAMITGLARVGDLRSARELFEEMPERNVVTFTAMIDGYAKAGDMVSARALFEQAPVRDMFAWSSMISGYAQNGLPNEAVKVFVEMVSKNIKPDEFTLVGLMSACSQVGCGKLAKWVDSYLSESSIALETAHVVAALIDMNAKCGNIERATELFETLPKRDIISYCSMIQGLSMHGCGVLAVNLFTRMLQEDINPDEVAFTVILTACSRAALVDEGLQFFEMMKNEYSIVPSPDHFAIMVDLLSRSGRLNAAYELLNTMPMEPNACAWGALLGASKLHGDLELGEVVARRLFELEPQNGGNYVLLSNIYAAADRWVDVSLLRNQMKERGVRKVPGCSWIS
ncbi:putative pentatricopeptide repeat-containing protein At5g37570 [Syzygium oleosum]|uniref:putative pentatricopeptide repeat-containing protein At5g37570 n=1 Tax=Syzygium oleosum TaxID=219896 RepID=UPI0024BA3633|nr:putative pentatricopeptide repeat-containing protein At5g37570 [Syzygium oleosum]XP_056159007.1 putative pentatricopeptide repeat-containing protein At5g37570 [Syzygium oleosum]XP_056159008.1 putative pentatricopeptide repeat-containing protein At5g37570 [Syzygium oleosum]XP_056159009.1 putative pentatricopeptide repeat-containing protein At5g37570 [Syzygium oleosum]